MKENITWFKIATIVIIILTGFMLFLKSSFYGKYFITDVISSEENEVLKEDLKIRTKADNTVIAYDTMRKTGTPFETIRVISVNERNDFEKEFSYYKDELERNQWEDWEKKIFFKEQKGNKFVYHKRKMRLELEKFNMGKNPKKLIRISIDSER